MYNDAFTPFDDIQCEDGIEDLFNEEGGLTADAFALLAGMDDRGEFSS
mgnify:CR=1 FL=1